LLAEERDDEGRYALWILVKGPMTVSFEEFDAGGWKRSALAFGLVAWEVGVLRSPDDQCRTV
jgi:hypothetical protein